MTRLTSEIVKSIPQRLNDYDKELKNKIKCTLRELAFTAVEGDIKRKPDINNAIAGVVPMTFGEGVIPGFSYAVSSIISHIGMESFVTENRDITGIEEAIDRGANILFIADDLRFIALNILSGKYVDNADATALGYSTALEIAAGGLQGKKVLVIGAGKVGKRLVGYLKIKKAKILLVDKDFSKASMLEGPSILAYRSIEEAIKETNLIINASPATIKDDWINSETVLSAPGVPLGVSKRGIEKLDTRLIHDPLQIGVAVMAVKSASL